MVASSLLLLPINLSVYALDGSELQVLIPWQDQTIDYISPSDLIPSAQPFLWEGYSYDQWYYYAKSVSPSNSQNISLSDFYFPDLDQNYYLGFTVMSIAYRSKTISDTVNGIPVEVFKSQYSLSATYTLFNVHSIPNASNTVRYLSYSLSNGFGTSQRSSIPCNFYYVENGTYPNYPHFNPSDYNIRTVYNYSTDPDSSTKDLFLIMWIYIPSEDSTEDFSGAVNPGQDEANDQLGGLTGQLEDFDDNTFGDLNDGLGSLDFGMSGFTEVASGIAYITGIFMIIWNGIPNQIIVVALMLGLVTLVLGRGARLASAVDRANRRRSKKG